MAQIIKTIFQFRRAKNEEWLANGGVIPAPGEPCYDLDLHTLKIGDGVLTYEQLPTIGGVELKVEADGKSVIVEDDVFKLVGFDKAQVGAQPRKGENGELEWVIPSTETVEGLKTTVTNLQSSVETLQTNVTNIQNIIAPSGGGTLLSRVETLETEVAGVDAKIDAKIEAFETLLTPDDDKINTLLELINYVESHGKETLDMASDIAGLKELVGLTSVADQIAAAGHITKEEANDTLLSKVDAKALYEHIKYEFTDVPVGTLVDYRDSEIRVMVPASAQFAKQSVGAGGDANTYYATFKTYAPNDNVVGYIEHLNGQSDSEILTTFSVDKYGRRYQPTWLGVAKYDEATGIWNYCGKNSTATKYIGWDYQIDWYDANGVMVASDKIRINLSNETCHNIIEPYYAANVVKGVSFGGTLLEIVDGKVDIPVGAGLKGSNEIEIAEDGTLSIGTITWDKIGNGESEIIIDGGGASITR